MNRARPVDQAMSNDRPQKQAVRQLWLEEIRSVAQQNPDCEEPWYLTLPGAEGRDIQMLIDDGLISMTEVESISESDQGKIVAVESSDSAVLKLQRKFIGLQIKEANFASLVRGPGPFSWPDGSDETCCRARVVNLDLNSPLQGRNENQETVFPVLAWIDKLCRIHSKPPQLDWTLCLTLHGDIDWPDELNQYARDFIRDNFGREPLFDEACHEFFGDNLYGITTGEQVPDFRQFGRQEKQKFIMVIVPKIIAGLVHNQGWRVKVDKNLCYGSDEQAPMVTWIVKFAYDQNAVAEPDANYRQALCDIFSGIGIVTDDGKIQ